jgi:hypothetical protein
MEAVGGNIVRFTYTGAEGEIIPREATHIIVGEGITFVRARAFRENENIIEIVCHEGVEKIEESAFRQCHSLRRIIMRGVKIVEEQSFYWCDALRDVECDKLEIIGSYAFGVCYSLRIINLPFARIIEDCAFAACEALVDVNFGNELERFEGRAFCRCKSLERITIPLKDGIITDDAIFERCQKLGDVYLVEEAELHETVAALYWEEWRNDMSEEIDSINQVLPAADAGCRNEGGDVEPGEKALTIRRWIRSVLGKIDHYKAEHQRMLNEATTLLELAIWKANLDETDESRILREKVRKTRGSVKRARREICITSGASIVIKNVLPFLQLKS